MLSSAGQRSPAARISRDSDTTCPGAVAVVEASSPMTRWRDQQVVAGGGGSHHAHAYRRPPPLDPFRRNGPPSRGRSPAGQNSQACINGKPSTLFISEGTGSKRRRLSWLKK